MYHRRFYFHITCVLTKNNEQTVTSQKWYPKCEKMNMKHFLKALLPYIVFLSHFMGSSQQLLTFCPIKTTETWMQNKKQHANNQLFWEAENKDMSFQYSQTEELDLLCCRNHLCGVREGKLCFSRFISSTG